jgi:hypothetical protein
MRTKKNDKAKSGTEKPASTARADYLESNPKAAELQRAHLKEITTRIGNYRVKMLKRAQDWIDTANEARDIGVLINDFLDSLPGKQMTTDFWEQIGKLFKDQFGNPITQDQLKWFVKVANAAPKPFDNVIAAMAYRQPMLLAAGDPGILELESERPPQLLHAPPNPLNELKTMLNHSELEDIIMRLRSDTNYCPGGRMREDLRATLRVELEPTFRLVDEIRRELE